MATLDTGRRVREFFNIRTIFDVGTEIFIPCYRHALYNLKKFKTILLTNAIT